MNQRFSLLPFSASDPVLACAFREHANRSPVFLSWDWQAAMREAAPSLGKTLIFMNGKTPLAFLSHRTMRRHGIFPVRQWHLNETGNSAIDRVAVEYNGLLGQSGHKQAYRWLIENLPEMDELVARNLIDSTAGALADAAVDARWHTRITKETVAPWSDLDVLRSRHPRYEEALGRNTRAAIRRTRRLYENDCGSVQLTRAGSLTDAFAFLRGLERLHTAQWKAKGQAGAFDGGHFRRFHETFLQLAFAEGQADLLRITAGKQVIGYLYNLLSPGGWVMAYQSGFAAAPDNRWKPGYLSHAMAVQHYVDRGASRYDFLAGGAAYKKQLAGREAAMRSIVVFAPRAYLMVENQLRQAKELARNKAIQSMRAIRLCPTK